MSSVIELGPIFVGYRVVSPLFFSSPFRSYKVLASNFTVVVDT